MKKWVVALLAAFCLYQAQAGTAPWWRWESQVDGRLVCSQWSPGEGWKRFAGPYNNGGCREEAGTGLPQSATWRRITGVPLATLTRKGPYSRAFSHFQKVGSELASTPAQQRRAANDRQCSGG